MDLAAEQPRTDNGTTPAGRYQIARVNAMTVQLQLTGSTNRARCMVQYVRPAAVGSNPNVTSRTDGC